METQAQGIVVGYDGSPEADVAVDWAAAAASRRAMPLTVLHSQDAAVVPAEPAVGAGRSPDVAEASRETLAAGVKRATGVLDASQVNGVCVVGAPAAELVRASQAAQFVVTGSRGRGRLAAGLLGSVSYAVTAHARCPAVVVRGVSPAHPNADHKVVVGIDDSEPSGRALDQAAEIAATAGAKLHIVRVARLLSPEGWAYVESTIAGTERSRAVRDDAEQSVSAAEKRARATHPDLAIETEVLYGEPGHVLGPLGTRAGLLVVGSRGRGGFAGLLLGSVSHSVIHEAPCPVMVVR